MRCLTDCALQKAYVKPVGLLSLLKPRSNEALSCISVLLSASVLSLVSLIPEQQNRSNTFSTRSSAPRPGPGQARVRSSPFSSASNHFNEVDRCDKSSSVIVKVRRRAGDSPLVSPLVSPLCVSALRLHLRMRRLANRFKLTNPIYSRATFRVNDVT